MVKYVLHYVLCKNEAPSYSFLNIVIALLYTILKFGA